MFSYNNIKEARVDIMNPSKNIPRHGRQRYFFIWSAVPLVFDKNLNFQNQAKTFKVKMI